MLACVLGSVSNQVFFAPFADFFAAFAVKAFDLRRKIAKGAKASLMRNPSSCK